jgi:hypothetical protein
MGRVEAISIRAVAGGLVGGAVDVLISVVHVLQRSDLPSITELICVPLLCCLAHILLGLFVRAYSLPEERGEDPGVMITRLRK